MLELDAKNQQHSRSIQQMNDGWNKEEFKLKGLIQELRDVS